MTQEFLTPTPYTPTQATPRPPASSNAVEELIDYLDNNVRDDYPERLDKKLMDKETTLNMEGICYP